MNRRSLPCKGSVITTRPPARKIVIQWIHDGTHDLQRAINEKAINNFPFMNKLTVAQLQKKGFTIKMFKFKSPFNAIGGQKQ